MALTLEQLQAQRDKLIGGMTTVQSIASPDATAVTYRAQRDIEAALAKVDAEIAKLQSSESRVFTVQSKRGF